MSHSSFVATSELDDRLAQVLDVVVEPSPPALFLEVLLRRWVHPCMAAHRQMRGRLRSPAMRSRPRVGPRCIGVPSRGATSKVLVLFRRARRPRRRSARERRSGRRAWRPWSMARPLPWRGAQPLSVCPPVKKPRNPGFDPCSSPRCCIPAMAADGVKGGAPAAETRTNDLCRWTHGR
jgi:hypothetical protein